MQALLVALERLPEYQQLKALIAEGGTPAAVGGLSHVHKAHIIAALHRDEGRPAVVICESDQAAEQMAAGIAAISGRDVIILPSRDFVFRPVSGASHEWEHRRIQALYRMGREKNPIMIMTVDAAMQRTMPPERLAASALSLRPGMEIAVGALTGKLVQMGYRRDFQVEGPGQFAVRGGIVDIFSPTMEGPVRIEFFGDEIDTMAAIDSDTQRRTAQVKRAVCLPVHETLPGLAPEGAAGLARALEELEGRLRRAKSPQPELVESIARDREALESDSSLIQADRYIDLIYPEMATALHYLPEGSMVFIDEHMRVSDRVKNYLWQLGQDVGTLLESGILYGRHARFSLEADELWSILGRQRTVMLESFISSNYDLPPRAILQISARQLPSYGGSLETALSDIRHYQHEGYGVTVLCASRARAGRLHEVLEQNGVRASLNFDSDELPPPGGIYLTGGSLPFGMDYPALKLAVMTEGQIAAPVRKKRRQRLPKAEQDARKKLQAYTDLSPGDLVVHEHHGIGRFTGIVKMPVDGLERDYIKIAYAGSDSLYVPCTQLDLVSKYIGAGEEAPVRLNKMGGAEWQRAKVRAKGAARDLARGLIALYAARNKIRGYAFPPDSDWQLEFEQNFDYDETDDQLRCIAEVKSDMEKERPMDRLLCGDVGFGKTEVALRAVMKCILGGKQAAMLVPTTVLAQQHFQTAVRRFTGYPVKVAIMSRFQTAARHKKTLQGLKNGEIDFVIGTHKLLQKEIIFKDLGLLIVDEEQRFGVTHKERLKEMSRAVDVLTLTATPIPRTLNMALSGIRDMSTIEEAPRDRHPVQTYATEHDLALLVDAIRKETARGGQVYYLHNRVESIDRTAARLQALLPDVQIGVGHGQMTEEALSEVMRRMSEGELQVLVCTTIIETGIDIPNVNTLIVEDADRLGLAQLHQIRGRVGRSSRHAYAYFTFRRGKVLTEVAAKRLSAIREFAEFGAGFKIALRDLEIRGAGNVLGPEQSGHLMSVGYDMYLRLLEEAVLEEQGKPAPKRVECATELSVAAHIPEGYISESGQRMDIYRRIARVGSEEEGRDLIDELIDRFGDPPQPVHTLVRIALLRAQAARAGIHEIIQKDGRLTLALSAPDIRAVSALCADKQYKGRLLFAAGAAPALTLRLGAGGDVLGQAAQVISQYTEARQVAG